MKDSKTVTLFLDDLLLNSNDFTTFGYSLENMKALVSGLIEQYEKREYVFEDEGSRLILTLRVLNDLLFRVRVDVDSLLKKGDEWRTDEQK